MNGPSPPVATYRLQFNARFRFRDAEANVPYLRDLGISHVYASPVLMARRGSSHGYDLVDPTRLNPELGTEREFLSFVAALRSNGMGLILDIVPNHMAACSENPWWIETLEQGPASRHAHIFDIDWERQGEGGRIVLPLLGEPYVEALASGRIRVESDGEGFVLYCPGDRLPLDPGTWDAVLAPAAGSLPSRGRAGDPAARALDRIVSRIRRLPPRDTVQVAAREGRRAGCREIRAALRAVMSRHPRVRRHLARSLARLNGSPGRPRSFDLLHDLLEMQAYRLAHWREASGSVNYRRFFDVNDLVGVRVEEPKVFAATHDLILRLVREGCLDGVRIDHIDGLADPKAYLDRLSGALREASGGRRLYLVVEKILSGGEKLRSDWPVHGTTGYEFGRAVGRVLTDPAGLGGMVTRWSLETEARTPFSEQLYHVKRRILADLFSGEISALGEELHRLAAGHCAGRSLPREELTRLLLVLTACMPVYRTYVRSPALPVEDRRVLSEALRQARRREPAASGRAWAFLSGALGLSSRPEASPAWTAARMRFLRRWQQVTGPAEAKGLEDTLLYRFNRLVALNEVGGDPDPRPADLALSAFHAQNRDRRRSFPDTMNCTSTHDSKRGEDVRARLHALSERPGWWRRELAGWRRRHRRFRTPGNGSAAPETSEEWLLYQTILGAWPPGGRNLASFRRRVARSMIKAAREAKRRTSWLDPDPAHERALAAFTRRVLDPARSPRLVEDLGRAAGDLAFRGVVNSLAQLLLKIASPGVPDFYQGTELWSLTLVDPDNRDPVDFARRRRFLRDLRRAGEGDPAALCEDLLRSWQDGRLKLYATWRALSFRSGSPGLFSRGRYIPLRSEGAARESVCAFARSSGRRWAICLVPVRLSRPAFTGRFRPRRSYWQETSVRLPARAPSAWRSVFTGRIVRSAPGRRLAVHRVLDRFPVALLAGVPGE